MKGALALRKPVGTAIANDCTGTTITSAGYVELEDSLLQSCSAIMVVNTSAKAIKLAIGAGGSEVDIGVIFPPSVAAVVVPVEFAKGARLSSKALGADATTGFFCVSFFQ